MTRILPIPEQADETPSPDPTGMIDPLDDVVHACAPKAGMNSST
jgi:hypothetical protein